jgi:hypothetical protein
LEQDQYARATAALQDHLHERAVDATSTEASLGPIVAEETAAAGQSAQVPLPDVASLRTGSPGDVIVPWPTP